MTSTPTGMSPTPSSSRIALISRAASRNSVRSRADGAAHAEHARAAVSFVQPRRVELVMLRGRAEVPDVGLAVAGDQRVAQQLVARPLADDRARRVADVVLIERQQRAEAAARERLAHARDAVGVQPAEIDALLEVDLRMAGRLQRALPLMMRIDVVVQTICGSTSCDLPPFLIFEAVAAFANDFFGVPALALTRFLAMLSPVIERYFSTAPPVTTPATNVAIVRAGDRRRTARRTAAGA